MNVLKTFASAEKIANSGIRTIQKCFEYGGHGKRIQLSTEQLKTTAKASVAEETQIRHLVCHIEIIEEQLPEIDKKKDKRVLSSKQLSYPLHSRNFTLIWYFHFIGIRRYLQLYKSISNHQICRRRPISL